MAEINKFLNQLATDATLQADFEKQPLKTMRAFELTEAQMELILEGSIDDLRTAIAEEIGVAAPDVYMVKMRP
ncbi:MAG TPA: hypothetical protein VFM40_05760 [Actinomycetota bacterium]|nr:hypothetical protein [Actinomycetota bacterium]